MTGLTCYKKKATMMIDRTNSTIVRGSNIHQRVTEKRVTDANTA